MGIPAAGPAAISRGQSALGLFFALTGALIATSILTIGDSGVPLFSLAVLVPILAAPFAWRGGRYFPITRKEMFVLLGTAAIFLLLAIATFLQMMLDREDALKNLTHAAIRLFFLVYFSICVYYLHGGTFWACLRWLRRILALLALYGIYQVPAKLLGLPLVLDWLRNNPSFSLYDFNTAGWVQLVRATSVYAEPSQCTVPVLALIWLNIYVPAPRWSKWIVWFATFVFAVLTFSRMIWVAIFVLILVGMVSRAKALHRERRWNTRWLAAAVLVIALVMPLWAFYSGNYKSDFSRQERAGSIVIGLRLVEQRPWLGSGWNSFEVLVPSYQVDVEGASPEVSFRFIHNMFVSYWEQAGVAGFIFGIFPFLLMLFLSDAPNAVRLGSVFAFLAVAELGGDVAYSSLFWLWVALAVNWRHAANLGDVRRSGVQPALDTPRR